MVNQKLVDYLKEGKKKGFGLDVLKKKLVDGGFSQKDVDEASSNIEGKELPAMPAQEGQVEQLNQKPEEKKGSKLKWILIIILILIILGAGLYFGLKFLVG